MYFFDSRVRYSETDEEGKLGIPGIVDYFQDVSTFQSEDLGLGVEYLKGLGLVWVMSAWQIVIHSYPRLGDRIRVGTFPYEFKGFMGLRNFFLDGEDGQRMAEANSVWTLMNLEKGIPARPTAEMIGRYVLEERLPMDYASRKIAVADKGEAKEPFTVGMQHLDSNHHVNNGQYIHMAMKYLPEDFAVGQMRAEYKKSALLHDTVHPFVGLGEGTVTVSLCDGQDSPYAVVEFARAKKKQN